MADIKILHPKAPEQSGQTKPLSGKAPTDLLTLADLVRHAESLIRFERKDALAAQKGVDDLSVMTPKNIAKLEDFCGVMIGKKVANGVRIVSDESDAQNDTDQRETPKVLKINRRG